MWKVAKLVGQTILTAYKSRWWLSHLLCVWSTSLLHLKQSPVAANSLDSSCCHSKKKNLPRLVMEIELSWLLLKTNYPTLPDLWMSEKSGMLSCGDMRNRRWTTHHYSPTVDVSHILNPVPYLDSDQ